MKRLRFSVALVAVAVGVLMLSAMRVGQEAQAQTPAENLGDIYSDFLHNGVRADWAEYLETEWGHKDKVLEAWFTGFDSILMTLKTSAKPIEVDLRKALQQSYTERVWDSPVANMHLGEKDLRALSRQVRIFFRYRG